MFTRVFVDETVLADYLGERRAYLACRDRLVALELAGCIRLFATPEACRRVRDGLAGAVPEDDLASALNVVLGYVELCPASQSAADGPDACLVSRRSADSGAERRSKGAGRAASCGAGAGGAFTPQELFDRLEREEGLAFELVDF